ncbi:MAG TPA: hypothetical protein VGI10_10050 [Polyangiaceae bacterium]|jgi:hypothetical protein
MSEKYHCDNCDAVMDPPFLRVTVQVLKNCAPPMAGTYIDRHATNLDVCGKCTLPAALNAVSAALLKTSEPDGLVWSCRNCSFSNLNGFRTCGHCGMTRQTASEEE